jgi:hypothetical protein
MGIEPGSQPAGLAHMAEYLAGPLTDCPHQQDNDSSDAQQTEKRIHAASIISLGAPLRETHHVPEAPPIVSRDTDEDGVND